MRKLGITLFAGLLSTALFSQTEGDYFFSLPSVHEIRFTFHQANYWDSLDAAYAGDYYIKGDVEIDGFMMYDCGVRFKGNSSYTAPGIKKSLKVDMNEFVTGQNYDGFKKLNLNNCFKDPTFLREKIFHDFLRNHGLYAPRVHFSNVYINDTLWGLYTAVEEVDVKDWLQNNIGDNDGNLFKGDPSGDLKWLGSTPSLYYTKYELKTNETANDWTDLVQFINVINNTSIGTLQTALDTIFDTDNYIRTWAVHTLFSNLDSYMGSGHNYYIYHDSTDLKFKWISWDANEAFGVFTMGMNLTAIQNMSIFYLPTPATNRPLNNNMLQVNAYKQALADAVCEFTFSDFSNAGMDDMIDSLADFIRTDVYADPNKFFSNSQFETNLTSAVVIGGPPPGGGTYPGLKDFISAKRSAVTSELISWGCYVGVEDEVLNAVQVYPNPTTDYVIINGIENMEDYRIRIFNALGNELLTTMPNSNTIDLTTINANGVLVMELTHIESGSGRIFKIIKQ